MNIKVFFPLLFLGFLAGAQTQNLEASGNSLPSQNQGSSKIQSSPGKDMGIGSRGQNAKKKILKPKIKASAPWSFSADVFKSESANSAPRDGKVSVTSLILGAGYAFDPSLSMSFSTGYMSDQIDATRSDWIDPRISLDKRVSLLNNTLNMDSGLRTQIPVSKTSRQAEELRSAFGGTLAFSNVKGVLISSLILGTSSSVDIFSHAYSEGLNGYPLTKYVFQQKIFASYSYSVFSISADIGFVKKWSYSGATQDYFNNSETLKIQALKFLSLFVRHELAGSLYDPRGQSMAFKFNDTNNSVISYGINAEF